MLARFYVHTPFVMIVPNNTYFTAYTYVDEGYHVTAMPPGRSDVPIHADVPDNLEANGVSSFAANTLQFEFRKDTYCREKDSPMDPPEELLRRAITGLLARLRYVTQGAQVTPIDFPRGSWRLQYLHDDGTELEPKEGLVRGRGGKAWTWSFVSVTPPVWDDIHSLEPGWIPPRWNDILLDATASLPKIGTAVVLAATALEVFIADVLTKLSTQGDITPDVWQWLNNRRDFDKNPSPDEEFDVLLKHYVGHSLKEEAAEIVLNLVEIGVAAPDVVKWVSAKTSPTHTQEEPHETDSSEV
ncbi:MAG: hypothetical protein ACOYXR_00005, partial [Nitrospirota bacterium]